MSRTVAVVFGGQSNENEISVITGTMAANVLKSGGDNVIVVYISQQGEFFTGEKLTEITAFKGGGFAECPHALFAQGGIYVLNKRGKPKKFVKVDAVLNCCHGGAGEGGGLSGLCDLLGLPLAGAGTFESSVFMNKYLTKLILQPLGIKTADFALVKSLDELNSLKNMPQFPVIVKPANLGSSIGVEKAETPEQLEYAVQNALVYDSAVIVETFFAEHREINCAAYFANGEIVTSECEEAIASGELLSFEDKYTGGGKSRYPADIPEDMSQLIKETVKKVYGGLNMRGIVRFDFLVSGGKVYLCEVNTVPGSLSYYLLSKGFKDFYRVLDGVLKQAATDFAQKQSKKLLKTGILENISANTCKLGAK